MKLREIEYGNILGASGVQGFFGEGYAFHRMLGPLRPNFDGMTFVAKTTTLLETVGNMPLTVNFAPKEIKPRCIYVDLVREIALNAVGLSGPGVEALLEKRKWQMRTDSFMISFMPTTTTSAEGRLDEMRKFVEVLKRYLPYFRGKVALQINITCPSVGLNPTELAGELVGLLEIAAELGIPLMPKFNPLVPPELVVEISQHPAYDATCFSNTIPFGKLDAINWKYHFPHGSPLAKFGGGGLSGPELLPIVGRWIGKAYHAGMKKPMNVGGGISDIKSINYLLEWGLRPGVDSVFIGTVAMMRPWRVQKIIEHANIVLKELPWEKSQAA
jgi:dihydroorotate dehydrogenase